MHLLNDIYPTVPLKQLVETAGFGAVLISFLVLLVLEGIYFIIVKACTGDKIGNYEVFRTNLKSVVRTIGSQTVEIGRTIGNAIVQTGNAFIQTANIIVQTGNSIIVVVAHTARLWLGDDAEQVNNTEQASLPPPYSVSLSMTHIPFTGLQ